MSMTTVYVNVADIERSVAFYRDFLDAPVLEGATDERAELDLISTTLVLRRHGSEPSAWLEDDVNQGYRHIGLKVGDFDARVARLRAGEVPFRAEPRDDGVGVRTTFFWDPDGTVLELIEGFVEYPVVFDEAERAAEVAAGVPDRPRFDHVASTVHDLEAAAERYSAAGFRRIGALFANDARGFRIDYLRAGSTILELFSYDVDTVPSPVTANQRGFAGVAISGQLTAFDGSERLGDIDGVAVYADPDSLLYLTRTT